MVTCAPVTCSGAAYSGVSAPPPSRVSALASAGSAVPDCGVALEQLGDTEVEQLDLTSDADEHVGRLEVAVNNQVGMRVRDRLQHIEEETETGVDVQPVLVAIVVDALALHVLEHQVRVARLRYTRIDKVGNVRMREPREDVALAPEALFAGAAHQRDVQQLDRRTSFEAAIAALGEPDAAHAALADM